jgi:hypothetical protein
MRELFKPALWTRSLGKRLEEAMPGCGLTTCAGAKTVWHRMWKRQGGISMEGVHYCRPQCLEGALAGYLARLQSLSPAPPPSNRMPLGLLMVARGKLTYNEVLAALDAQRRARYGKIGKWFEKLGFATEQEVTAALALQWGCPVASVLKDDAGEPSHRVPLPILEAFHMWPLHDVAATNTLYLAFGERVDHGALYAIEQMLDCRTQPCVAGRKAIAILLERFAQQPRPSEVQFAPLRDPAEMARIASSYIVRMGAEEIRVRRLGSLIWLRLKARSAGVNVLFRLKSEVQPSPGKMRPLLAVSFERLRGLRDNHAAE